MERAIPVSILISSYNYGRFLRRAIDSALEQRYPAAEVIVVDDCSTDDSVEIIRSYGDGVRAVLRDANLGGRATYDQAPHLCTGEVVVILDSDDALCPTTLERAAPLFTDPGVVKVQWPLWEINGEGARTKRVVPCRSLPDGDVREQVARHGPWRFPSPPTSGNAWRRSFLARTLPLPRGVYADAYLSARAYAAGAVRAVEAPQGFYRVHGQNSYNAASFERRLQHELTHVDRCCNALRAHFADQGITVDTAEWTRDTWYRRLELSVADIAAIVPADATFVLVDEDNWGAGGVVAGRRALPFPEAAGAYAGHPASDSAAVIELERLRAAGASHVVFAWQAFWWLEHYTALREHVRAAFRCVLENDCLIVFDLRPRMPAAR